MLLNLADDNCRRRLAGWISETLGAVAELQDCQTLDGGAIQQNWLLTVQLHDAATCNLVLRTDAPATIAESRSREQEFRILQTAWQYQVKVPEPLGFCHDASILGQPFSLVRKIEGIGYGPKVVKNVAAWGNGDRLAKQLAAQMARIHAIDPLEAGLTFIDTTETNQPAKEIQSLQQWLDDNRIHRPALQWGLRWADCHPPQPQQPVFLHRDFRTGNLMVNEDGLQGVLDWEFSGFGDPMADIGWFCAECWRFSRPDLGAGGLADRTIFYQAYEQASNRQVDHDSVLYWELVAHLRWAVIALQQGQRHLSGEEPSLAMAITSRIVDQLELIVVRMTGPDAWNNTKESRQPDTGLATAAPETQPAQQSTGEDLLAIARSTVSDSLIPSLPDSQRLNALMVNNAIGIVERELQFGGQKAAAEQALLQSGGWTGLASLANAIGDGELDGDGVIWKQLRRLVALQSEIFKPGFASEDELR